MVEFTSIEVMIPLVFGVAGFLVYIATVFMNMSMLSKNKMGGTVLGKLLGRLGIAWMLAGVTSVILGIAYLQKMEYSLSIVTAIIIIWWIGAILVLDAIIKWKNEMK